MSPLNPQELSQAIATPLTGAAKSLPIKDSALQRADSYRQGFNLIVDNLNTLSATEKTRLRDEQSAAYQNLDKQMQALAVSSPLTKANLTEIENLQKQYYDNLAQTLSIAAKESLGTVDKWLEDGDQLANWKKRSVQSTSYQRGENTIILIEKPILKLTPALTQEYLNIADTSVEKKPEWFKALPAWEQSALKEKVAAAMLEAGAVDPKDEKSRDAFANALGTSPCTIRKYPGLTNFSEHTQIILDKNGDIIAQHSLLRSATPIPFQIKNKKENQRILQLNLEQFSALNPKPTQASLVTGLVTPIAGQEKAIVDGITKKTNELNQDKTNPILYINRAINYRIFTQPIVQDHVTNTILETAKDSLNNQMSNINFPLPSGSKLITALDAWKKTGDYAQFEKTANQTIAAYQHHYLTATGEEKTLCANIMLRLNALKDYVELLHKQPNIRDDRNPNFYVNTLEQILVDHAMSGCKSGKDREGMLLIHRDAMIEQFYTNGFRLPNYYDTDKQRKDFCQAYAANFLTHHQATNAGLNAAGAQGLKALGTALPKDIKKEIISQSGIPANKENASIFDQHKVAANRNRQTSGFFSRVASFFKTIIRKITNQKPQMVAVGTGTGTPKDTTPEATTISQGHTLDMLQHAAAENHVASSAQAVPIGEKYPQHEVQALIQSFKSEPGAKTLIEKHIELYMKAYPIHDAVKASEFLSGALKGTTVKDFDSVFEKNLHAKQQNISAAYEETIKPKIAATQISQQVTTSDPTPPVLPKTPGKH